jgi:D-inositol-3-phosphate glycosyltransferase
MADSAVRRAALFSLHSSPLAALGGADAGGMNLYVRTLADGLCERGVEVDAFTRRTDKETPEVVHLSPSGRVVHVAAGPARPVPKSVLPLHVPAMVAWVRSFMQKENLDYDVLHSHYWLSGLTALRCRDDDTLPIVHMFHTLAKLKEFYAGRPDPADSALRPDAERCIIGGVDALVGCTESEGRDMERLYARSPAEFHVIPPGVDTDLFRPHNRQESRHRLGLDADRVILFVGRLDRIKGLDVLFQSVAQLRQELPYRLTLLVVGDAGTDRPPAPNYRRMANKLGLASTVDFRGMVPAAELPLYYSAADVCAMPSSYESFGTAAIEAMACQTPVVAFGVGGLATTVHDGRTGFLATPGRTDEYAAKLRAALECDHLATMGRRGRLFVHRFSWSDVVARHLELYDALARRRLALYREA